MNKLLITPTLIFLIVFFVYPVSAMLWKSIYNVEVETYFPRTVTVLSETEKTPTPPEKVFKALALDFKKENVRQVSTYLGHYYPGARKLIIKTSKQIDIISPPYKESFANIDKRWLDEKLWNVIRSESSAFTFTNYKRIFTEPVYLKILARTFIISLFITMMTVFLAYPVAYWMSQLRNTFLLRFVTLIVLLPFWTSFLARLISWLLLLQQNGMINYVLVHIGLEKVQLLYNLTGTFIGSVYVLLPMAILSLYVVMKNIPTVLTKVATTLGSKPLNTFWKVYFPMTLPGIYSALLIVFITVIGFYTTPAMLGGTKSIFVTQLIVDNMQQTLNWEMAAALSSLLFIITLSLLLVYLRVNNTRRII